ncbi:hypothetical protein DOY81_000450, partial [Sarcophaga bullata]
KNHHNNMFISLRCTLFAIALVYVTVTAEPPSYKTLMNILNCASSIPCPITPPTPPITLPTTPSTLPLPTSPKPICPNCPNPDCSMVANGTTFPYVNHCRLFYMCVGGNAEICTCPNGQWYDRSTMKCALCELVKNCIANVD